METERNKKKSEYKKAFQKCLNCKPSDFEIKKDGFGYLIKHDNIIYGVWSTPNIEAYITDVFTTDSAYFEMELGYWMEMPCVLDGIHLSPAVFLNFLDGCTKEQLQEINLALNISRGYDDEPEIFWNILYGYQEDGTNDTYIKFINAIAETIDISELIFDYRQIIMDNDILNAMQVGVCEYVTITKEEAEEGFYVFTTDRGYNS